MLAELVRATGAVLRLDPDALFARDLSDVARDREAAL
jgi:hypothetical protein